jgi:hypothetical protein
MVESMAEAIYCGAEGLSLVGAVTPYRGLAITPASSAYSASAAQSHGGF